MREIELKVVRYQDEIEAGIQSRISGMSVSEQVQKYRESLLRKVFCFLSILGRLLESAVNEKLPKLTTVCFYTAFPIRRRAAIRTNLTIVMKETGAPRGKIAENRIEIADW